MSKQSGLGDALYCAGYDLSGDTGQINSIGSPRGTFGVTGIDKSAMERIYGTRDGQITWTSWFNPTGAHPVLSALPTADVLVTYCRGTTLGDPAACMVAKQANYDGNRGNDGSLTFSVQALANRFGLDWGRQGTAGIRTDTAATDGDSIDDGAASSFGLQAYLQATAFTGTDATVKIQESSDDGVGDAWADVVGGDFTQLVAAGFTPTWERIATAADLAVERYLRVVTETTGGITSLSFAVAICRNAVTPPW